MLVLVLAALVSLVAAVGALRLTLPADDPAGVRRQLRFLRLELDRGAGADAQAMFPEGYFFLHVLYGLTEVQLGLGEPAGGRDDEIREAAWALDRIENADGRAPFDPGLTPAYGVFYRGWTNWLRGGLLALRPDPDRQAEFERDSAELAAAFDAATSPFLPAYAQQSWPVDSTVAIASLSLHDHLLAARFGPTVTRWLAAAKQRLDPATGLLPHRADVVTGAPIEGSRGSSQSVIQRFLPEIDPEFARSQYLLFRKQFRSLPLGLGPAIREYPAGTDGVGDVDSGPLVLGVSFSATVVGLGAARVQGDARLADGLGNYGDFAGLPIDTLSTRRYAFGLLPIGDAFLAWSKTARTFAAAPPAAPPPDLGWWWRTPLLTVLLAFALTPWLLLARRRRRRSARTGLSGG